MSQQSVAEHVRVCWPEEIGCLVVGHGTVNETGASEAREVALRMQEVLARVPVELGFLECVEPTISQGVERLASRGCSMIIAAPLLLFSAGHAMRDVPEELARASKVSGIEVFQAEVLGCHPQLVALSQRRRHEAIRLLLPCEDSESIDLFVGRGSSDPEALDHLLEFAALSARGTDLSLAQSQTSQTRTHIGFVAVAKPSLQEAIQNAASEIPRRVVVRPHLLFAGKVEMEIQTAVASAQKTYPRTEWVLAKRLGCDHSVVLSLLDRATAVIP